MDSASILGIVTEAAGLLTKAYEYGKAVKEAHGEMAKLYSELLGLKGALEQLSKLSSTPASASSDDILQSAEFCDALLSTQVLVKRLTENLQKKQTSSRRTNAFLWPFVKDDVKSDIADLERVKSHFTLMMMAEDLNEMRSLLTDSQQILAIVKDDHVSRKRAEEASGRLLLKEWLQPVDPTATQDKVMEKRLSTTGSWFIKCFDQWQSLPSPSARVLWLHGKSGSGKTSLLSAIVDRTRSIREADPRIGLAYHSTLR